ncbi:hypothetical protein CAOG_09158 [Capsaspora owczarzaki ATCC 30864]|uniref:Transposase n=2 Tax=Capsaspora owczarzaki TaxID=192875 RepID=W4P2F1_9EUKA|nr:hypothetical protein CAOG_09158 [Capsaspora owczarzaki ATCC 30864]FAA01130.1 TPA: transposase [Capsaspora owczarzaki]|eukprot:XP_011270871.1 hypothetical protein CAOG_09158 [Capsaspora owczarzaki ATCC 30864]
MAGASEAATRCLAWLQAVKAAPEGEKHNVAVAVALKLVYQDSVTLQGGEIYRPTGWTTRAIAARLAEQGYQCGHTTVHDWKTKHADSAEWIRSSPLDQVLQLVKESPSCGGQSIFTEDELEYCIRLLEGFARAGQCLNQKQAGAYLVKLSRLPRMSGAPRRQFAGSLPSHEWWNAFLRDARGRLAIRKGRTLELTRIAALQAETLDCLPGLLKQLFDEHPLLVEEPGRISNMDETEITTRFFAGRVICTPSSDTRSAVVQGGHQHSLGAHITGVFTICADGSSPPLPMIIFSKNNKIRSATADVGDNKAVFEVSPNGYMTKELFHKYLSSWEEAMRAKYTTGPLLLVMDGSSTHQLSADVLARFLESDIHVLVLPAHTSTESQPLDRTVFGFFKTTLQTLYKQAIESKAFENDDKMRVHCALLAWDRVMRRKRCIRAGFRLTGIWPLDETLYKSWILNPTPPASELELDLLDTDSTPTAPLPSLDRQNTPPVIDSAVITPVLTRSKSSSRSSDAEASTSSTPSASGSPSFVQSVSQLVAIQDISSVALSNISTSPLEKDKRYIEHEAFGAIRKLTGVTLTFQDVVTTVKFSLSLPAHPTHKAKPAPAYIATTPERLQSTLAKEAAAAEKERKESRLLPARLEYQSRVAAYENEKQRLITAIAALDAQLRELQTQTVNPLQQMTIDNTQLQRQLTEIQLSQLKQPKRGYGGRKTTSHLGPKTASRSKRLSRSAEPVRTAAAQDSSSEDSDREDDEDQSDWDSDDSRLGQVRRTGTQSESDVEFDLSPAEKRNMAENVRLRPMRRAREQAPDHDDDAPGRISQRARLDSPDQAVQAPPALVDLSHRPNHLGFVPAMFPSQHLFIQ